MRAQTLASHLHQLNIFPWSWCDFLLSATEHVRHGGFLSSSCRSSFQTPRPMPLHTQMRKGLRAERLAEHCWPNSNTTWTLGHQGRPETSRALLWPPKTRLPMSLRGHRDRPSGSPQTWTLLCLSLGGYRVPAARIRPSGFRSEMGWGVRAASDLPLKLGQVSASQRNCVLCDWERG